MTITIFNIAQRKQELTSWSSAVVVIWLAILVVGGCSEGGPDGMSDATGHDRQPNRDVLTVEPEDEFAVQDAVQEVPTEQELGFLGADPTETEYAAIAEGKLDDTQDRPREPVVVIEAADSEDAAIKIEFAGRSSLADRTSGAHERLVAEMGGTPASEEVVASALAWLAAHQLPDGSWNFNHQLAPKCQGKCDTPGELFMARSTATALALLPFLEAGQSHMEGNYKEVIKAGLKFLVDQERITKEGGHWKEEHGTLDTQGLATLALCEAYGMTRDEHLRAPAQSGVYYLMNTQDKTTGTWKDEASNQTSFVEPWRAMALMSADRTYLEVWPNSVDGIAGYLKREQAEAGQADDARLADNCFARLCLGKHYDWTRENAELQQAMKTIAAAGPSNNLQRDLFATQFLFQMTAAHGEIWEKWNTALRDRLIKSQDRKGHEAGSWPSGSQHGRLMNTALSTLILEVYYRYLRFDIEQEMDEHEFPVE